MRSETTKPSRVIFDMETDGLLEEGTEIHTICTYEIDTGTKYCFGSSLDFDSVNAPLRDGILYLNEQDILIGHNLIGFDIPFLLKMGHNITTPIRDTLVLSKLLYPEQKIHGLGHYGKKFGRLKPEHEDWSRLSEEMIHRCKEDVEINVLLYDYFIVKELSQWNWMPALILEQLFQFEQVLQELEGVDIDIDLALSLLVELDEKVDSIDAELKPRLPKRIKASGATINAPFLKSGAYNKATREWFN